MQSGFDLINSENIFVLKILFLQVYCIQHLLPQLF